MWVKGISGIFSLKITYIYIYIAPENRPDLAPKRKLLFQLQPFSGVGCSGRVLGIWKNYKQHLKSHWTVWILMQTFRISLGNITWLKALKMKGFSWWLLPYTIIYVGEMFINLVFSWTKDHDLRFFHLNVARFFSPSKNQFLTSARSGTLSWWQGVMLAIVLLPLHYQALSCQSFTMNSRGLYFIDSCDGRLTRIPRCWISWVSLILEAQHETAIGWD